MKKHLAILLTLSLFCIVLAPLYGGAVFAATEAALEEEEEGDVPSATGGGYAFTVERGTLTMPDGVKLAVSYWMSISSTASCTPTCGKR